MIAILIIIMALVAVTVAWDVASHVVTKRRARKAAEPSEAYGFGPLDDFDSPVHRGSSWY